MPTKSVPVHLKADRYWAPTIFLFSKQRKLRDVFTTRYFDFDEETIDFNKLKKVSAPWSHSEKVMLQLALHLFNERNKFNLSDLDCLDSENRKLAFKAIKMRFGG